MEEYTKYGKPIMKNIRKNLIDYKKEHNLTNQQMAVRCDLSLSEYDKIMNVKTHSKYGCSIDTFYKICFNLKISSDGLLGLQFFIKK